MNCGVDSCLLRLGLAEELFVALGGAGGTNRCFTPRAASGLLGSPDLTSRLRITGHDDLLIAGSAYKERFEHVQAVFDVA